ncbi:MAG: purine nucleoside permease [Pseudomonadota bacterium]
MLMPPLRLTVLVLILLTGGCAKPHAPEAVGTSVIAPKVIIVTMFERGADTGDAPGEFQLWNERRDLDATIYPSGAHHDFHYNPESGILGMVTGIGTARAAASVMALGMDPRFDTRNSYWLIAGIAGFDPADASIGSAAWAEWLVDGDISHEIDAREKPADWQWGYIARYTKVPFEQPRRDPSGELYRLNPGLVDWAYALTKDLALPDNPALAETRARYTAHVKAQEPPVVLRGAHLAASTFWHGELLNDWANAWVDWWTKGQGNFVSSAMEETGTLQSITYLHNMGRANPARVLSLRTASNFTIPPPGVSAAENLLAENEGYSGLEAALESAYLVGSVVVDALLADWAHFEHCTPGDTCDASR